MQKPDQHGPMGASKTIDNEEAENDLKGKNTWILTLPSVYYNSRVCFVQEFLFPQPCAREGGLRVTKSQ